MKSISPVAKHTPERTCLACRKVKLKAELIRLVRTSDGGIAIDASGKSTGRGAYLCRSMVCWQAGLNAGRLEHALKSHVALDNREQLLEVAKELLKGAS